MQNQLRNNLKTDYSIIPNKLIQDSALTDRARFVYVLLASKPDGWKFYNHALAKETGYSVDTLRKYINELVESGWIVRKPQAKDDKGKFTGNTYIVMPAKTTVPGKAGYRKTPTPENPDTYKEVPTVRSTKYKEETKKDMQRVKTTLRSKRKSLKGLSKKEVLELYHSNPDKPPEGYTRPQMLAGVLDHTPGMEQVVERYGWRTIMLRLGQLFNGHRKVHLKYRDVMEAAIELDKIPAPYGSPPSIDYLVAALTNMAENKMADRFEVEAQARKDQVEDRDLLDALADNFRMPE